MVKLFNFTHQVLKFHFHFGFAFLHPHSHLPFVSFMSIKKTDYRVFHRLIPLVDLIVDFDALRTGVFL